MTGGPPAEDRPLGDDERADLEVFTGVRMKSVRFGVVPEAKVRFSGDPAQRSSAQTEREGLPEEVEPEVEYRDATVRWTARARIVHPTDAEEEEE